MVLKAKDEFLLKEIAGQWILMPTTDTNQGSVKIMTLTSSAALLWSELAKGVDSIDELANALLREYDIEYKMAVKDSMSFVAQLREYGMLDQ